MATIRMVLPRIPPSQTAAGQRRGARCPIRILPVKAHPARAREVPVRRTVAAARVRPGVRLLPGKIPPEVPVLPVDRRDLRIPGGSTGQSTGSGQGTQEATEISCTISIRCDSISGNGILTANGHPELESYAANPVILGSTAVKVKKGASVYDVLLQACRSAGIHLESSYTPAYGSYYVQGINHLYEWQAGPGSGWTYTVNGRSVSVGASACKLSDGDVIVWEYVHR